MEIDSNMSVSVESNSDNVSDIIIMDSSDTNLDNYTSLPVDFESSDSSLETMESMDDTIRVESNLPVFTDVAEETVYETEELFDDALRFPDKPEKDDSENLIIDQHAENSLSDILVDNTGSESSTIIDISDVNHKSNDASVESELPATGDQPAEVIASISTSIADAVNKSFLVTSALPAPSTSEISNLITISKNTNLASGVLEKVAVNNVSAENSIPNIGVVPGSMSSTAYAGISNVIQVNSIGNNKNISNLKPFTIQNTRKLLPISIAPTNTIKRPASISIGQPTSNVSRFFKNENCPIFRV